MAAYDDDTPHCIKKQNITKNTNVSINRKDKIIFF